MLAIAQCIAQCAAAAVSEPLLAGEDDSSLIKTVSKKGYRFVDCVSVRRQLRAIAWRDPVLALPAPAMSETRHTHGWQLGTCPSDILVSFGPLRRASLWPLFSLGVFPWSRHRKNARFDDQWRRTPLTAIALSPDGSRVAYADEHGVYVLGIDSRETKRIAVFSIPKRDR